MANRRRFTRVRAQGLVAEALSGSMRIGWDVENLSLGGMFVRTAKIVPPGTTMLVSLRPMGSKSALIVSARVVYSIDALSAKALQTVSGMGITFVDMSSDATQKLDGLIRMLSTTARLGGDSTVVQPRVPPQGGVRRRQHRRIEVHKLQADLRGDDGEVLMRAVKVKDISPGGLFLESERSLVVGSDVVIELTRPGKDVFVAVRGRIIAAVTAREARMRDATPGMSVRFIEMSEEIATQLQHLVETLAPSVHWGREQ